MCNLDYKKSDIMNMSVVDNSPKELESFLLKESVLLRYKKGETILHAEDPPPGIFFIQSGYVRLFSISEDGEELTLIIFRPGDAFPLSWVIDNIPNIYNLEAMTQAQIYRAPKEKFVLFLKRHPEILFEFTKRILVRLTGLLTRMEQLVFGNAYAKVASILYLCGERFGKKTGRGTVIELPLTHKDIGLMVGITRETTSIEMKKLERKGLVFYQNGLIVIKNLKLLKEESSSGGSH